MFVEHDYEKVEIIIEELPITDSDISTLACLDLDEIIRADVEMPDGTYLGVEDLINEYMTPSQQIAMRNAIRMGIEYVTNRFFGSRLVKNAVTQE